MSSSSNPVVAFANAAALLLAHLKPIHSTLAFAHDVPKDRTLDSVFIRIFRTGGVPRVGGSAAAPVVDGAQLTIESWAPDADVAETNAQAVRRSINDLPGQTLGGHAVYLVEELAGPAELPDPFSNSRRVTWTVVVHIRGS